MREKKKIVSIFLMVLLVIFSMGGISVYVGASEDKKVPKDWTCEAKSPSSRPGREDSFVTLEWEIQWG